MAYMSQEKKRELAPGIKAVLKKYGMQGTISVDNHSSLVVNVKSGDLDVFADVRTECPHGSANPRYDELADDYRNAGYINVNTYHIDKFFEGKTMEF